MPGMKVKEQFLTLSKEHILINEAIQPVEDCLNSSGQNFNRESFMSGFNKLGEELLEHFKIEEQVLFPAALMCMPSLELFDTILCLQKEHGYFEKDFACLQKCLNSTNESENDINEFFEAVADFLNKLKKHAQIEIDDIFRIMDKKKKCTKILKGYTI